MMMDPVVSHALLLTGEEKLARVLRCEEMTGTSHDDRTSLSL